MPLYKLPQTNFTSGIIGLKRMRGRADLKQYYNGASVLNNVNLHPQGGVYRRDGTLFLYDYDNETIARPITFDYSDTIQYILVFYPGNIDVWKNDVLVHTITATGLTLAQIREMDFTQSANSMIIVHSAFAPKELVRGASDVLWTLGTFAIDTYPLFAFTLSSSTPAFTLTPSGISGSVRLTASGASFASTNVGGYITGGGGEARITRYVSTTVVEAEVIVPFIDTTAMAASSWTLEVGYENAWSSGRGWPRAVTYHDDRLFFASTSLLPNTWWFSKIGDYGYFNDTRTNADDASWTSIKGDSINTIRALQSADDLMLFCNDSEYYIDGVITADQQFKQKRQDKRGIRANVKPLYVDGQSVYVDAKANVLRGLSYDDLQGKYNTVNLNLLSGPILNSPVSIAHKEPKDDIDSDHIYVANGDGTFAVLNTLRNENITGWTTGDTDGEVQYFVSLDGALYCTVVRTIGGVDVTYFEKFSADVKTDSTIRYSGVAITTVTGLSTLEGKLVDIVADGKIHEQRTVTGGEVTIDWEATDVDVGLPVVPEISLLPPNRELPDGTMIGKVRRVVAANIGMSDTFGVEVSGWGVKFLKFGEFEFDQTPPLYSGRKRVTLRGYSREPIVTITQVVPSEFHVTDVVLEVVA